jgi:alkylated DNA repair dioxygenase AlkB
MSIRAKTAPRRVMHIDLEPGSLFVMSYATQLHYTHAVPKTPNQVGERISLAFRVKRPRIEDADAASSGVYS